MRTEGVVGPGNFIIFDPNANNLFNKLVSMISLCSDKLKRSMINNLKRTCDQLVLQLCSSSGWSERAVVSDCLAFLLLPGAEYPPPAGAP